MRQEPLFLFIPLHIPRGERVPTACAAGRWRISAVRALSLTYGSVIHRCFAHHFVRAAAERISASRQYCDSLRLLYPRDGRLWLYGSSGVDGRACLYLLRLRLNGLLWRDGTDGCGGRAEDRNGTTPFSISMREDLHCAARACALRRFPLLATGLQNGTGNWKDGKTSIAADGVAYSPLLARFALCSA